MTHFDRFSNRARVEPNTPHGNYRYNRQFEEQQSRRDDVVSALVSERNDAISRFDMLQRDYNAAMARFEAQHRSNEELTSLLDASRRQVDQLYTTANALQRELQIATLGSRACADAVAQSTSCMAELQRFHQQYDELQQKNNKLQQELHVERQSRRAADNQLNHQAEKYQDMKARAASDVHVIADLRSEVAKLNNKIAQLEGDAQVRELRITSLERQKSIVVPASWGPKEPQTPRLRLKSSFQTPTTPTPSAVQVEVLTMKKKDNDLNAPKTPTTRSSVMKQQNALVAEALEIIDGINARTASQRDFEQTWQIAKHVVSQKNMQENE